jgi:hypothetical protein
MTKKMEADSDAEEDFLMLTLATREARPSPLSKI